MSGLISADVPALEGSARSGTGTSERERLVGCEWNMAIYKRLTFLYRPIVIINFEGLSVALLHCTSLVLAIFMCLATWKYEILEHWCPRPRGLVNCFNVSSSWNVNQIYNSSSVHKYARIYVTAVWNRRWLGFGHWLFVNSMRDYEPSGLLPYLMDMLSLLVYT